MGKRLTERTSTGVAYAGNRTKYPGMTELNMAGSLKVAAMREVMELLAEYEDTGLTPDEIKDMARNYRDIAAEWATRPPVTPATQDALIRLSRGEKPLQIIGIK